MTDEILTIQEIATYLKLNEKTAYPDDELADLNLVVYQHVYANYQGAGNSTYGSF